MTKVDIKKYVHDKVNENNTFQRLTIVEPDEALEFVREIVEMAEGIFLWVKLVAKSLLTGIKNRDELSDL